MACGYVRLYFVIERCRGADQSSREGRQTFCLLPSAKDALLSSTTGMRLLALNLILDTSSFFFQSNCLLLLSLQWLARPSHENIL